MIILGKPPTKLTDEEERRSCREALDRGRRRSA